MKYIKRIAKHVCEKGPEFDLIYLNSGHVIAIGEKALALYDSVEEFNKGDTDPTVLYIGPRDEEDSEAIDISLLN